MPILGNDLGNRTAVSSRSTGRRLPLGARKADQTKGQAEQTDTAKIGSIRLTSSFLTLPTRGLTGQHVSSSDR
jgi:hypothetical protein